MSWITRNDKKNISPYLIPCAEENLSTGEVGFAIIVSGVYGLKCQFCQTKIHHDSILNLNSTVHWEWGPMVGPVMVRLVSSHIDQDIPADTKTNRLIWIQILKFTALSSCVYTKAPTSGPVMVVLVSGLIDQPGSRSPLAPLRHSTAPHEASCQASVPASASSQSPHPLLALHITSNPSNQESYLHISEFLQSFTAAVALKL